MVIIIFIVSAHLHPFPRKTFACRFSHVLLWRVIDECVLPSPSLTNSTSNVFGLLTFARPIGKYLMQFERVSIICFGQFVCHCIIIFVILTCSFSLQMMFIMWLSWLQSTHIYSTNGVLKRKQDFRGVSVHEQFVWELAHSFISPNLPPVPPGQCLHSTVACSDFLSLVSVCVWKDTCMCVGLWLGFGLVSNICVYVE